MFSLIIYMLRCSAQICVFLEPCQDVAQVHSDTFTKMGVFTNNMLLSTYQGVELSKKCQAKEKVEGKG